MTWPGSLIQVNGVNSPKTSEDEVSMRTRISLFCDKVIEAGWLAAVVIVPLLFNIFSQRVFEPDKLSLLRSIAVVMLVAWLIKILETRSWKLEDFTELSRVVRSWKRKASAHPISNIQYLVSRNPLLLPSLLLVATYILATITSIFPHISFNQAKKCFKECYATYNGTNNH